MIEPNLIFIKPKEHYVALKRKTHYYLDNIYKKNYAPRHKIGSCSFLYKTLKPASYQDFYEKYIDFCGFSVLFVCRGCKKFRHAGGVRGF